MDIKLSPRPLCGSIPAIPSKSHAHRLLICAAFADGPTEIILSHSSEDIDATLGCLSTLGAGIARNDETITVAPIKQVPDNPVLDCRESGSTFRFLLPVAATLGKSISFMGTGRLPLRPIGDLKTALESGGVTFTNDRLPLSIQGKLTPQAYLLPGNVSSQYVTGLLMALPLLDSGSAIVLESPLQSRSYVDITIDVLRSFGAKIIESEKKYDIYSMNGHFRSPGRAETDGDWSNAAFFLAAGALGNPVTVTGLSPVSTQGDKAIISALRLFGAETDCHNGSAAVYPHDLTGCELDAENIPDLVPILAVVAACAHGETRIKNCARLRLKESDRLKTTADMIRSLGGWAEEDGDMLVIRGGKLRGGTVSGAGDHRIVMSAAIAAIACHGEVTITGAEAVRKSYPLFFNDYSSLGGNVNVL